MEQMMTLLREINILSITVRILLALLCGGVIGLERRHARQPAGMRTYMLVCMGASLVMITGQYMFNEFKTGDPARLGAQVISGIGFLGAGTIITSGRTRIRGLTTAAGLWASACIGLTIGIGFYEAGFIASLAVFAIMTYFKQLEDHFVFSDDILTIYAEITADTSMSELQDLLNVYGLEICELQMDERKNGVQKATITLKNTEHFERESILRYLQHMDIFQFVKYTL